jgi:dephospho-CoA kinase
MIIVGVAGESGTGKTTISAHLTTRGGGHIDLDIIGHEVLTGNEGAREEITSRISAEVFDVDGRIDRRRLGAIVFNDEKALRVLEKIVHPRIQKICNRLLKEMERAGLPFVVVDGALLLDADVFFSWDVMIALRCDEQTQFERLMAKGGRTEAEVRQRLNSQRRIQDSLHKADVIIDACRPLQEVMAEIDGIIDRLLAKDTS